MLFFSYRAVMTFWVAGLRSMTANLPRPYVGISRLIVRFVRFAHAPPYNNSLSVFADAHTGELLSRKVGQVYPLLKKAR